MPRDRTIDDAPQNSFAATALGAISVLLLIMAILGLVFTVMIGVSGDVRGAVAAGAVAVASAVNAALMWAFRDLCTAARRTAETSDRIASILEGVRRELMSREPALPEPRSRPAPAVDLDRPVSRSARR